MESKITPFSDEISKTFDVRARNGAMLVIVLVITAVGLLFGAGALLLFKMQSQMRIDRQHELEKVYAVRSVLNYIRTNGPNVEESFKYCTGSERQLELIARPTKAIFPSDETNHFYMGLGQFTLAENNYNEERDYEYGMYGWTNLCIDCEYNGYCGLAFKDLNATNNVKWWVNIGMRGTGGWLHEDYGRRYYFLPMEYVKGHDRSTDIMRLCIIRNVTNIQNDVGCRYGWPLSKNNERALVFEIKPPPNVASNSKNAIMTLSEYVYLGGIVQSRILCAMTNTYAYCNMGLQLASDKASLFYIENSRDIGGREMSRGYTFSETIQLPEETYKYFSESVNIAGNEYPGVFTNDYGMIESPELRAVLEVEAASDLRGGTIDSQQLDFLTNFRVTKAYQYDILIVHPSATTNLATVAQRIGDYSRYGVGYTMLTYDTHGTENKGFRKDEKLKREQGR